MLYSDVSQSTGSQAVQFHQADIATGVRAVGLLVRLVVSKVSDGLGFVQYAVRG